MTRYGNGLVPQSVMKQFRNTGKYGVPQFIDQLEAAFQEAARAGIALSIAPVQDIFRDIDGQRYWKNYWTARGLPGNAAAVGTSNHGLGIAADITGNGTRGTARWNTVRAIFRRHSIDFLVASEGWHCAATNISTAGNSVDVPASPKGDYSGNPFFPSVAAFAAVQGGYAFMGYDLGRTGQDGKDGPVMDRIVRQFQAKEGLPVDGTHGPNTEKRLIQRVAEKAKAAAATAPAGGTASPLNPYGLSDVRGLQKIARANGYKGAIDNLWGSGSATGFNTFLRNQGGLAAWLRKRWGYVGNDVYGPNMRAALARANEANYRAL